MQDKINFKTWLINFLLSPFNWSRWVDIQTFRFGDCAYLLQGKVNKITNGKKFKVVSMKSYFGLADIKNIPIETLIERGLIDTETKWNK